MLRRLLLGLVLGAVLGGMVAAGLVAGLGVSTFSGAPGGVFFAYLTAALVGVLTGLVAGKPIWATGAKIEAGLKALFGAALGAGVLFALRQWAPAWWAVDFPAIGAHGHTPVWDLPATALPLVAALLGAFFELDNNDAAPAQAKGGTAPGARAPTRAAAAPRGARVAGDGAGGRATGPRLADPADSEAEDDAGLSRRAKH
jgi:hypothetical protein